MALTKITSAIIESGAIDATALANNSITIDHLDCSDGTSGQFLKTDGSGNLSFGSVPAGYTDSDVESYLSGGTGVTFSSGVISIGQDVSTSATPTFGNITTTGYIAGPATFTIDPAAVGDNTGTVVIAGNLQVDGTTTTINSTTMTVDDLNITLASGAANAAAANGAGITVDGASAAITYDGTNDEWDFNKDINVTGTITASGNITGTLATAAQPNITSLGTLTGFTSTGIDDNATSTAITINGSENVGINVSSPGRKFEVDAGAPQIAAVIRNTSTTAVRLGFQDANTTGDNYVNVGAVGDNFVAYAGGGEKFRISSTGNVGIGTTSPTDKLNVAAPNSQFRLTDTDDSTFTQFSSSGGILAIRQDSTSANHVFLNASGNVGIGTSSIESFLTLDKDVSTAYDPTDDGAQRSSTNTLLLKNEDGTANSFAQIAFDLAGSNQSIARIVGINAGASTSDLAFVTEHSNTKAEKMRITSEGYVGIGTDSPANHLHIASSGANFATIRLDAPSNTTPATYLLRSHDGNFDIRNSLTSTTALTIDSSGNLMVGKTSVGVGNAGIELRANNMAAISRASDNVLYLNRITNDGSILEFRKDNVVVGNIGVSGGNNPYFSSAVANHGGLMFSDGGSSTPQMNPISSGSTLVDNAMNIGSASYRFKDLYLSGNAYVGTSGFLSNNSGEYIKLDNVDDTIEFSTASTERMRIRSDGGVGIGSSGYAGQPLTVNAGSGDYVLYGESTDALCKASFRDNSSTANIEFGASGNNHIFSKDGTESMRIDSSGNVGIGTTSPGGKLHVQMSHTSTDVTAANSNETLVLGNAGTGNGVYNAIKFGGNQQDMYIMSFNNSAQASRRMGFFLGSVAGDAVADERLSILGNGNVGIGTTSPSTELHVKSTDQNALTVETDTAINQIHLSNSTNSPSYITQDSYGITLKADDNAWGGTASNITFRVKNSEKLKIAHDGETTISGTKMNVVSSAEAVMGAQATGYSYWRVVADNSPNTYFQAGTGATSSQVKMYFTGMFGSNNTMTVDTPNSRVGIGITSPGKKLDVRGTVRATAAQNDISLSDELPGYGANSYGNLKASANNIYLAIGNSYIGYINSSAQLNASDARLKENVATLTGALDKVNQLRGVSFNWIDSARGEGTHIGFIAQELEEVYPELVGDGDLPNDEDGNEPIKSVDYGHMVPVLVEAIKELKAENDALKARLDAGGL